jgi:HCOMODA/2-hydroxy-3-carboxy-muconic semialdehyde decarboxylase
MQQLPKEMNRRRFMHSCCLPLTALAAAKVSAWQPMAMAQQPAARPATAGPVAPELLEDLVAANHILASEGVLDGFGHVSVRHDKNPNRYLLSRSLAPALVTAADIIEYDLDSRPVDDHGQAGYLENFIHGEIYKARPDVKAVVHNHSLAVIPFAAAGVSIRPMYHMSAFLGGGVPVFEIRKEMKEETDMLIRNAARGAALARVLGPHPAALLRGHGAVVVADNIKLATFNCVYLQTNAELQMQAMSLSKEVNYLSDQEAERVMKDVWEKGTYTRAWDLWKKKVQGR